MLFQLKDIFESLLLPPGILVVSLLLGIVLLKGHRFVAALLLLFTLSSMYLISTPWAASKLTAYLETYKAINLNNINDFTDVGAIVVLAGGRENKAPEYNNGDTVGSASLIRLRFAAKLSNKFSLPILLSGGAVCYENDLSEATLMKDVLMNDFGIKGEYLLEETSKSTKENAKFSATILKDKNIKKVFLVTQAWHMKRAIMAFENVGLNVIPAPTGFYTLPSKMPVWALWLPKLRAFVYSSVALHEYIGILWYQLEFMI